MAIDELFYKNVFLLMQVVPASYECNKYFKKGMFDKPNTLGFVHISHYLLSVHDKKHFQKRVIWPLMNKLDEKRYRMEIKEYLEVLANENQDMNFPLILRSHLLQAGGTKFLILMWKISQISLRAYIARKCQIKLLQAPNIGDNKSIIQIYFTTMNRKRDNTISKFCEKTKSTSEFFEYYIQCSSTDLKNIQTAIFEVTRNIEKLVPILPVSPFVLKRLTDIDDTEIINLWKKNIDHNIKFLRQKNSKFKKLEHLSSKLCNLILDSCVNYKFFNGNDLPKINSETLSLCLTNNFQHVNNKLYINGCLVFQALLSILDRALKQIERYLKLNGLSDLSSWEPKTIEHCETIKSMEKKFQQFAMQVSGDLYDIRYNLQEKSTNYTLDTEVLYSTSLETIFTSPKFNFSTGKSTSDEKILKNILVSPIEGKYKYLFKRYRSNLSNSPRRSTERYRFNDNADGLTSNWKSPQRQSLSFERSSSNKIKLSPRYSKLFSTSDSKKKYLKDNATSTPNLLRKTPKKSNIQISNAKVINIDTAIKNIFDLACKITDVVTSLSES